MHILTISNNCAKLTHVKCNCRTPSSVELRHNDKDHEIAVQVLGTEETWQTPSLLLAQVKNGQNGRAVFSQVHLEIDPEEFEDDEEKFKALQKSNGARLEILKDILSKHFHLKCDENTDKVQFGPGYFLGRYDVSCYISTNKSEMHTIFFPG